ncbi:dnaJ homolog subfamily C member 7-like [Glandiceps talaboti]
MADVKQDEPMDTSESEKIIPNNRYETTEQLAEAEKKEGNVYYADKEYREAIKHYTKAIDACPNCASYYGNRAAAYIMLKMFKEGLEDARQAVLLDESFVKGHLREAKCNLALGDAEPAIRSLQHVLVMDPGNKAAPTEIQAAKAVIRYQEIANVDFAKGDYRKVVFCMDRALDHSPACSKFKTKKAEALVLLKRYGEAQEIANDLLQFDNMNADAIYIRGLCLYYEDNIEKALQHFQQVLRLSPDHTPSRVSFKKCKMLKLKKEEGNAAFNQRDYEKAFEIYSEALQVDPNNIYINAKLYNNRATACAKLNRLEEAIANCTKAVELDEKYLKAYLRRAKCYMDSEMYEEAVRDYDKVFQLDKTRENKRLLQDAKLELKKSKRKDYYKILGVGKTATDEEIKKAYKKRALMHHPDRHANATPEERKDEETKFKEVGEAFNVLSDSKKRMRYDNGQDLDDEGHGFGDFDADSIFRAFFSGGPGSHFGFGGGGGQGGYPGGFEFHFG